MRSNRSRRRTSLRLTGRTRDEMASVYRASVNRASLAVSIGISRYAFYGFADLYLNFVSVVCEATLRANSSVVRSRNVEL